MSAPGEGAAALIAAAGLCTPLGLGAAVTLAEIASGTLRFAETETLDAAGEPLRASWLPLLAPSLGRGDRMAGLAAQAMIDVRGAIAAWGLRELPLFLGLPDREGPGFDEAVVLSAIARAAAPDLALRPARTFRGGRAACFQALAAAVAALSETPRPRAAIVGAVDSQCDRVSLATLAAARRLLGPENRDGLIPGEGAGFLLVVRPDAQAPRTLPSGAPAALLAIALGAEAIPFRSAAPSFSEGLSDALGAIRKRPGARRVERVLSCQTGERFFAIEYVRACIRNAALVPAPPRSALVASSLGDAGAASGAVQIARASLGPPGRALVYGAADDGAIGACVVEARAA